MEIYQGRLEALSRIKTAISAAKDGLDILVEDAKRFQGDSPASLPPKLLRQLGTVSDDMCRCLEKLQAESTRHRDTLVLWSQLNALPDELLITIFEWAAWSSTPVNEWSAKDVFPVEMVVSHVSRRWREVAVNTPTLWTRIQFFGSLPLSRPLNYIERSRSSLIDVSIDIGYEIEGHGKSNEIMHILHLHLSRVRLLDFTTTGRHGLGRVRRLLDKEPAPRLEYCSLSTQDRDDGADIFRPNPTRGRIFSCGMPRLRTLRMKGTLLPQYRRGLQFLTTLDLCIPYSAGLCPVSLRLALAPCLGTLEHFIFKGAVEWIRSPDFTLWRQPYIHLPALKSLTLVTEFFNGICSILDPPNLTSLDIDLDDAILGGPDDTGDVAACLRLSDGSLRFPKVQSLVLRGFYAGDIDVTMTPDFFRGLPRIKTFRIARGTGNNFLRLLARSSNRKLWPCLEDLILSLPRHDLLRKFLRVRSRARVPIKRLSLRSHIDNFSVGVALMDVEAINYYVNGKNRRYVAPDLSDMEGPNGYFNTEDESDSDSSERDDMQAVASFFEQPC